METVYFKTATVDDLPDMLQLFRDTILHVNLSHYTQDQVEVWANAANNLDRWIDKINEQHVLIAHDHEKLLGFGSLRMDYIDLLYIHKDHQGEGIASSIYSILEGRAREYGMQALATDASHTARGFFEKKGFVFVATRTYIMNGVEISNCRMVKSLHD
jgi:putative acetyltransferase